MSFTTRIRGTSKWGNQPIHVDKVQMYLLLAITLCCFSLISKITSANVQGLPTSISILGFVLCWRFLTISERDGPPS